MTALAKILSFPSNTRICQCIGSDKTAILQTSGYCTYTVSFTDLETPPEWESVFCLHTTSRNVQYKQSWAELHSPALPSVRRGGVVTPTALTLSGPRTQPVSFYLAAPALWFGRSCSSSAGPKPCPYNSCGRGTDSRMWSCVCCWVHPAYWRQCRCERLQDSFLRWSKCSYCGIFILKPWRKIVYRR